MLFTTFGATTELGATPSPELVDLKDKVDRCIRLRASNSFTNDDQGAANNLFCTGTVLGNEPLAALRKIEKLTFLEDVDNQLVFNIARTLVRQWRTMGMAGGVDSKEAEVRRIAAQKLGEPAVGNLSPDTAIIQLSGASREEIDAQVQLAIIVSLAQLITKDTAPNIRTEAITSLKILADSSQPNAGVRTAAVVALRILDPQITLEIGPATVTSLGKPRSKFLVPILVGTAIAATTAGVIWYVSRSRRYDAHAVSGVGPLRRRVEAQLRRRRAR
jgi:hypothetical protein